MYIPVFCWACNRDSKNREGRTKQLIVRTEPIDKDFVTLFTSCMGCGVEHSQIMSVAKLDALKKRGIALYGSDEKQKPVIVHCFCSQCSLAGNRRPKYAVVLEKTLVNHGKNKYFFKVRFIGCGHIRVFVDLEEKEYERIRVKI